MEEIKFRAMGELKTMFQVTELNLEKGTWSGQWVKGRGAWAWNQLIKEHPLMQYTGLKDKNGREIYEGDIVTANYDVMTSRYKVVIEDGHMLLIHPAPPPLRFYLDLANRELYEVIGNIWENPELLEVKPRC